MITTVFFDLDGTLLPMDFDEFTNGYFKKLVSKAMPLGYEPEQLIQTIWGGCKAMAMNSGIITNEEVFWKYYASVYGEDKLKDKALFDEFYANEFNEAKDFCGYNQDAVDLVAWLKNRGIKIVLATNPIFPRVATQARLAWAGFEESDFEFLTAYEDSNHAKPNPMYYQDCLDKAGVTADEVIMVGNDAIEDLAAAKLGIKVFLITDCLINKENTDISDVPHGTFEDLKKYLELQIC